MKSMVKRFGSLFAGRALSFSLSAPKGGEGRGEEVKLFPDQIPSPQPSPRLGGARELEALP